MNTNTPTESKAAAYRDANSIVCVAVWRDNAARRDERFTVAHCSPMDGSAGFPSDLGGMLRRDAVAQAERDAQKMNVPFIGVLTF